MTPSPRQLGAIKGRLLSFNPPRPYRFWQSCVSLPGERAGELIQYLNDHGEQITYSTFARHADLEPLREQDHPAMYRISRPDNWAISFWRSRLPSGQRVYYFDWSRIEHIFVAQDVDLAREYELLGATDNPSVPGLVQLPVIQRGHYPRLIVGQMGRQATFDYEGWTLEVYGTVRRPGDMPWSVHVIPPNRPSGEHGWSQTFDGAVCVGKIMVDLIRAEDRAEAGYGAHLTSMWGYIGRAALDLMHGGTPPTRAAVARQIALDMRTYRQHGREIPTYLRWWELLPLPLRVSLIDDGLEIMYCAYGPSRSDWPRP